MIPDVATKSAMNEIHFQELEDFFLVFFRRTAVLVGFLFTACMGFFLAIYKDKKERFQKKPLCMCYFLKFDATINSFVPCVQL